MRPNMNLETQYLVLQDGHTKLIQLKKFKRECIVCPLSFRRKNFLLGLGDSSDLILDIIDLMIMFRLPKDYFTFLNRSGALQIVVNSILSLPWLCLERYIGGHPPFSQFFKSQIQLSKNKMLSQGRPIDYLQNGCSLPYLNYGQREKWLSDANDGILNYFLDIKLSHPVSDKPFQAITFSGSMIRQPPDLSLNGHQTSDILIDASDFSNLCSNFMGYKELFVPHHVCLIHLDFCVPSLGSKHGYSGLIYLPEDAHVEPLHRGRKPNLFSINFKINETTGITLLFKDFEVEVHGNSMDTDSILNPAYTRDGDSCKTQRLRGFSLLEFYLTFHQKSYTESSRGHLQDQYNPNHFSLPYEDYYDENYEVESAHNSYYDGLARRIPAHENGNLTSGYQNRGYAAPIPTFKYDQYYSESRLPVYSNNFSREIDSYGLHAQGTSHLSSTTKNQYGYQAKGSQNGKPKVEDSRLNPYYTLPVQGSTPSKPVRNPSSQSSSQNEEPDIDFHQGEFQPPSKESLLKDSKLFKNYANSKSKSPIILNLLPDLKEDDVDQLLTTLEPIIKEVCNNKYGNYLIQKLARSLPVDKLERFTTLVLIPDSDKTSFACHFLPSERNLCTSGDR